MQHFLRLAYSLKVEGKTKIEQRTALAFKAQYGAF